jgi:hypothetical protein
MCIGLRGCNGKSVLRDGYLGAMMQLLVGDGLTIGTWTISNFIFHNDQVIMRSSRKLKQTLTVPYLHPSGPLGTPCDFIRHSFKNVTLSNLLAVP